MFKRVAVTGLAASLAVSAQKDMRPTQSTDKEKIADALRAGPVFITKDAVNADWPANPKDPNAVYRILRAGKNDWTCLPGIPGYPHDEPMCLDKTSMQCKRLAQPSIRVARGRGDAVRGHEPSYRYHSRQDWQRKPAPIPGVKILSTTNISKERREELLKILKTRFEKNMKRHEGLERSHLRGRFVWKSGV